MDWDWIHQHPQAQFFLSRTDILCWFKIFLASSWSKIFLTRQAGEASCQPMPTIVPVEVFPVFFFFSQHYTMMTIVPVEVCLENDDDDHSVSKLNYSDVPNDGDLWGGTWTYRQLSLVMFQLVGWRWWWASSCSVSYWSQQVKAWLQSWLIDWMKFDHDLIWWIWCWQVMMNMVRTCMW